MSTFILIGLNPQGLSMLRILSCSGHNVVAFTDAKKVVGYYSKYGEKRMFSSIDDLKQQIKSIQIGFAKKLNCIITSGKLLALILSEFPEIYDICDVQSGPLPLVKMLSHKNQMYEFASKRRLQCAKYVLLSDYKENSLKFPVILKRNIETPLFFKVKKINTEKEFFLFIRKIKKEDYRHILIQEFISDKEILNISFQGYFKNAECLCSFICNQERRLNSGITSFLKEINNPKIINLISNVSLEFFKNTEYTGFAELEFIYSEITNELYFIEINARTCGLHSALNSKFKNISILYDDLDNQTKLQNKSTLPVQWINITRDIRARLQLKDFKNLSQFFTSKYDILDWHDLKPFFYQFLKL